MSVAPAAAATVAGELVLEFRDTRVETEDEIAEIEDAIFELLADGDTWTGHTITPAVRSVTIATHDAAATLRRVLPFLARAGLAAHAQATAIAASDGSRVVLWPVVAAEPPA